MPKHPLSDILEICTLSDWSRLKKMDPHQAIEELTQRIEKDPCKETYNNRGVFYRDLGKFDEALADYTQGIALDPESPNCAVLYTNRGIVYYENKGKFDEAIADFNQAILLKPDYDNAYYNRGICYKMHGKSKEAIADITHSLAFKPEDAEAYYQRGLLYQIQERDDEAIEDFNQVIALTPKNAGAYYQRGLLYQAQERRDEAMNDFNHVIKLSPKNAAAYYNRGLINQAQGKHHEALEDYRRAVNYLWENFDVPGHVGNAIFYWKELENFLNKIIIDIKNSGNYHITSDFIKHLALFAYKPPSSQENKNQDLMLSNHP